MQTQLTDSNSSECEKKSCWGYYGEISKEPYIKIPHLAR